MYSGVACYLLGALVSWNDSRLVTTFTLNVEHIGVGKVCRNYLASHLDNVIHIVTIQSYVVH